MQIAPVATLADLEDFQALLAEVLACDFVGLPAKPLEEWLPVLDGTEQGGSRSQLYVARVDGTPVGIVNLQIPTLDNLASLSCELYVHPEHRGRGHGRRLAEHALQETRALGRTRVFAPVATHPGRPSPGTALLEGYGFKPVIEDTRRLLDLHEHPPGPRPAAPPGYRLVQWVGTAPEELVDGLAYLNGRMVMDMPMGDMDYEPERWDATRYRETEADATARHRERLTTVAVDATGRVVGLTEIYVSLRAPETAEQGTTIVDPEHRGHGLGLVLKAANHGLLAEARPHVRFVNTWNATSNSYMIRVNEAVGFRAMETWTEYQLDL